MRKSRALVICIVAILGVIAAGAYTVLLHSDKVAAPVKSTPKTSKAAKTAAPAFNKNLFSLTDPASLWVVVNKKRPLQPPSYTPTNLVTPAVPMRAGLTGDESMLRIDAAEALEQMVTAAQLVGVGLNLQSAYRSYNYQTSLYNRYVARDGQTTADTYSARAGYSEHQTGLAADLGGPTNPACNIANCFGEMPEGRWLAANANNYGFIVRYVPGKEAITGYQPEPWHVRFVGIELAKELQKQGITTLEEFFGLPPAPNYE